MADVIIVGKGPAGISSSLYTVRAGFETIVVGRDRGALEKAEKVENYYGFENAIIGNDLINNGIAQAKRLGVEILSNEVLSISYDNEFIVKTKDDLLKAKAVILSTGSPRTRPKIQNLEAYEGKGVSYCASCDAFFYKGKDVAVIGCCDYAKNEVMELLPIANSVTLLTNGEKPIDAFPDNVTVNQKKIERLAGENKLTSIVFSDGEELKIDGMFIAMGIAGSGDLAKKIGAFTNGNRIIVDENMATNVPGLFAAGDCTGGMLQISKAVYEGARAGTEAIKYLRKAYK